MLINATRQGQRLCMRITSDLVDQQKQLLEDLAPELRAGVVQVIQRLATQRMHDSAPELRQAVARRIAGRRPARDFL